MPMRNFDEFTVDPAKVRSSFDRASASYDSAAVLQARVRAELLDRLSLVKVEPQVVLDLGCGTGQAAYELKRRYKRALVVASDVAPGMLKEARRHIRLFSRFERVCADAAALPFAESSLDLVFSNLMLQWCNDLDEVLGEIRRVLKPGGFFTFTTFGPDTLKELRAAWATVDSYNHVNRFLDMHDIGDALTRAGFTEPVLDVERIEVTYNDVLSLMRDLKAIGAHNVTQGRSRGLTGRARLQGMIAAYETFRRDGRLPATHEVIFGAAWGAPAHLRAGSPMVAGEARVPLSTIRRRSQRDE